MLLKLAILIVRQEIRQEFREERRFNELHCSILRNLRILGQWRPESYERIAATSFSEAHVERVSTTPGETEWQTVVNRIEHGIGRGDDGGGR
jgi:hypothetical protein